MSECYTIDQKTKTAFLSLVRKEEYKKKLQEGHIVNPNIIESAINAGYLDMCRTLSGASNTEIKLGGTVKAFETYFSNPVLNSYSAFHTKHTEFCEAAIEDLKDLNPTYGQAQKIVNMTFKYLYCAPDADSYKKYFRFCHIPLDSYTLSGLKRIFSSCPDENLKNALKVSWSKLNKEQYGFIADAVASLFSRTEDSSKKAFEYLGQRFETPLDAEFYIWECERDIAASLALAKLLFDDSTIKFLQRKDIKQIFGKLSFARDEETKRKQLQYLSNLKWDKILPEKN